MSPRSIAAACAALALLSSGAVAVAAAPAQAAAGHVRIYKVVYDPSGKDTHSNHQLNREYVTLKNTGHATVTMTHWTLRDTAHHVYRFHTYHLKPGHYVTVHTGSGHNVHHSHYWGKRWYVWNNTKDTAILRTAHNTTIDRCGWTRDHGWRYC